MTERADQPPAWVEPFFAELPASSNIREAARRSGVPESTVYGFQRRHHWFRRRVAAVRCLPAAPARSWGETRIDRFLEALAETSNVTAAAAAADLALSQIYHRRRSDPAFARRWYAALAEGYDNLEMELLGRLRAGESSVTAVGGSDVAKGLSRKFDTATALRCLTAHRESVAREKGRRSLAEEVTTIAAINAKIDRLRARQDTNRQAVAKARKSKIPVPGKTKPAPKTKAAIRITGKCSHG